MANVLLFHSVLGLRPAVLVFAKQLRAAGHTVTTPDIYNGETFDNYEAGSKKWFAPGIPALLQRRKVCQTYDGAGVTFPERSELIQ